MPPKTRVDWFRIIHDIKRHGISMYALEAQVGIAKTTLIGYKQGGDPRHADGEILVNFWCKLTGNGREQLPVERVPLSAADVK